MICVQYGKTALHFAEAVEKDVSTNTSKRSNLDMHFQSPEIKRQVHLIIVFLQGITALLQNSQTLQAQKKSHQKRGNVGR